MSKAIYIQGDLKQHLKQLSYPMIISLLATMSFSLVDMFFVSKLGSVALAALAFTFPILEVGIGVGVGLGVATIAKVGQSLGRGEYGLSNRYAFSALFLAVGVGVLLSLIGISSISLLCGLLKARPDTLNYIHHFMRIWYLGAPLLLMNFVISFVLRGHGFAKRAALMMLLGVAVNLALDPILIFGCLGLKGMGIAGAAWAGVIARAFGVLLGLWLLKSNNLISGCRNLRQIWSYWTSLLQVMVPAIITNLIPPLSVVITTYLLACHSQAAVAAYGIGSKVMWLTIIPLLALSGALSSVVSQNYGANKMKRVAETFRIASRFSIVWGLSITILLAVTAPFLVRIFSDHAKIIQITLWYLYIVPISFGAWGVVMMVNSTFNAMRHAKYSALISVARMIVVYIPLALIFSQFMGEKGIFVAVSFANLSVGAMAFFWLRKVLRGAEGTQSKMSSVNSTV